MRGFALCLFLFTACEKSNSDEDQLSRLRKEQWFVELWGSCENTGPCYTVVSRGFYQGQWVYFGVLTGQLCDPLLYTRLYNVNGEVLKVYDETNATDFDDEVTNVENVWSCR